MALQSSGAISINNINVEIGRAGAAQSSMGETALREITTASSGTISMSNFYGRSAFAIAGNYWRGSNTYTTEFMGSGTVMYLWTQSAVNGGEFTKSGDSMVLNKPIRTLSIYAEITGDAYGSGSETTQVRMRLHNSNGTIIAYGGWTTYDTDIVTRGISLTATGVSAQTVYVTLEVGYHIFNIRNTPYIQFYVST